MSNPPGPYPNGHQQYPQGQQPPYGQGSQPPSYPQGPQNPQGPYQGAPPQNTSAYPTQGYPTTGQPAPTSPYAQTAPPQKKKRRGRLAGWIAAAAVLLLLVAGGIVGGVVGTQANAPEREVEEYLDALIDGDAEAALKTAKADVGDTGLLLSDDVYGDVEDRISGYEIGETTMSGETAEVAVAISQGDESYDATFTLEKAGKAYVVFDTWRLRSPELGAVSYSVEGPEDTAVAVNGVDTSGVAAGDGGAVTLPALPGTYTVALAGESEYLAAEPLTVTVTGFGPEAAASTNADGEEATALAVTLTDAAVTAGEDAVNAYLDTCAASTDFRPDGCPFAAQGENPSYEYSNCVWTVDRPTFVIGEYDGGEWPVSTDSSGSASLECDVRDPGSGATGTSTAGPMDVDVSGAITEFGEDGATYVP
jgi:hypothetical protein